jgi:hypothetical protein
MDLALNKAPDILFDQQIWLGFKSYFDSPDTALERISSPPQIPGGYYHRSGDKLLPTLIRDQDQVITPGAADAKRFISSAPIGGSG